MPISGVLRKQQQNLLNLRRLSQLTHLTPVIFHR